MKIAYAAAVAATLLLAAIPARAAVAPEAAAVSGSNTAFATDLYGVLAKREGNLLFSPYSTSTALAMTWSGASGKTAQEMAATLHFGNDAEAVHKGFSLLQKALSAGPGAPFEIAIANRLFAQEKYKFLAPFLALTRDRYNAPVELLDFTRSPEPSRQHINQWVESQTKDKIKSLLPPGIITGSTKLVLANAIYFKGSWKTAFDKTATRPTAFTPSSGKAFEVPMMYRDVQAGFAAREGMHALSLPYRSGSGARLSMLVLLPDKADGLAALEKRLTAKMVSELIGTLPERSVQVWLPRFKIEMERSLSDALEALGMKEAFDCREDLGANFGGMDGQRDLCISAVVHKAFVDVSEEGTEAAAATAVVVDSDGASPSAGPPQAFRADHPFVFAIVDEQTKSVLFLGRVEDPRK